MADETVRRQRDAGGDAPPARPSWRDAFGGGEPLLERWRFLRYATQGFLWVFCLGALYIVATQIEVVEKSQALREIETAAIWVLAPIALILGVVAVVAWLAGDSAAGFLGMILEILPNAVAGRVLGALAGLLALAWASSTADALWTEYGPQPAPEPTLAEKAGDLWRGLWPGRGEE